MSLYLYELGIDHDRLFLDTGWEGASAGPASTRERAQRESREPGNPPAWFQNPTSRPGPNGKRDGTCWPIARLVQWSRSAQRGNTLASDQFLFESQPDGCMRWGLCDTGAATASLAEVSHAR